MARLILHIGTHKTGTTSLQTFLYDNADLLLEQGIRYPEMWVPLPRNSKYRNAAFLYHYGRWLSGAYESDSDMVERIKANIEHFREEAATYETIMLSDELLWKFGADQPKAWPALIELLKESGITETDIVVYLRRQDQFLYSLWNQRVKANLFYSITFSRYVEQSIGQLFCNYYAVIKLLEELFGKDHIHVGVYERSELVEGDIIRDYCAKMGIIIDDRFVFRSNEENPGLNGNIAEVKRLVNVVEPYRAGKDFLRDAAVTVALENKDLDKTSFLTPELSEMIVERFESSNELIAREYFGRDDGRLFSSDPVKNDGAPDMASALFMESVIQFFTAAITEEHNHVVDLEKRVAKLETRAEGLNASLGIVARLRRKAWRSRRKKSR